MADKIIIDMKTGDVHLKIKEGNSIRHEFWDKEQYERQPNAIGRHARYVCYEYPPKVKNRIPDMTREKAIDILKRLKTTHMGDFGWDTTGLEAFEFAIADMRRVEKLEETDIDLLLSENIMFEAKIEELETENKRLKEGIAKAKAKVERKCIGKQFSEAVIYGMQKAVGIFDECLGE